MHDVTQILQRIEEGESQAGQLLLPLVYDELRKLARSRMSMERSDHTLETTALVHEAYLRLVGQNQVQRWDGRGHFFAAAAEAMRRILVEHARRKLSKKQGGDRVRVPWDDSIPRTGTNPQQVLEVDEALTRLAEQDEQAAELVKLHCFAGFSIVEAAEMLGISKSSAYNDWSYAKALMGRLLADD